MLLLFTSSVFAHTLSGFASMFCSKFLNRSFLGSTFACDADDQSFSTLRHFFCGRSFTLRFAYCFGWLGCLDSWLGYLWCSFRFFSYLFGRLRFSLDRLGLWSGLLCFHRFCHFRCRLWSCLTYSPFLLDRWNLWLTLRLGDTFLFSFWVLSLLWVNFFLWRFRCRLSLLGWRRSLFDLYHMLQWVGSKRYLSEHHQIWRLLSLLFCFHSPH